MSRGKQIDRDHVLDVAEELVFQAGAGQLTFDAVAKAAGITKGGVQSCFGTKDNLITTMLKRYEARYEALVEAFDSTDQASLSRLRRHIRINATAEELNTKSAALLAALLQSKEQLETPRKWYAEHFNALAGESPAHEHMRIAFLAAEGAFFLRYLGLADFSDAQWAALFDSIEKLADSKPAKGRQ